MKRLHHLRLDVDADSIDDLVSVLRRVEFKLLEEQDRGQDTLTVTSGGWSDSYQLDLFRNEGGVDGDTYRAHLKELRERR